MNEQRSFKCAQGTRDYRLLVPTLPPSGPRGLVMMLHGCKQDADDFARGTRMNDLGEKYGLIVAWPNQKRLGNSLGCWQWFLPHNQRRGRGEPAILAELARSLVEEFAISKDQVFAAGLSAAGAMSSILGATYLDVFSAIGVHSGLPHGAARDVPGAFVGIGRQDPHPDDCLSRRRRQNRSSQERPSDHAKRCWRPLRPGYELSTNGVEEGRRYRHTRYAAGDGGQRDGLWMIKGAGHAWSGGSADGWFTDESRPNASEEMLRFFLQCTEQPAHVTLLPVCNRPERAHRKTGASGGCLSSIVQIPASPAPCRIGGRQFQGQGSNTRKTAPCVALWIKRMDPP